MRFTKGKSARHGLKHIDRGMLYIGKEPVRVILGPCLSIFVSSAEKKIIGASHIYPTSFEDRRLGPYNHPENIVATYLRHIKQLQIRDAAFWITDRESTTTRGKEVIMRSIDAVVQANYLPTLIGGFPDRCTLTVLPEKMQIEVYDIASHE